MRKIINFIKKFFNYDENEKLYYIEWMVLQLSDESIAPLVMCLAFDVMSVGSKPGVGTFPTFCLFFEFSLGPWVKIGCFHDIA